MKGKISLIIAVSAIIATTILIGSVLKNPENKKSESDTQIPVSQESAEETMNSIIKKLKVSEMSKVKGTVDYSDNLSANLPNIETKYPLTIKGEGDVEIEIFNT